MLPQSHDRVPGTPEHRCHAPIPLPVPRQLRPPENAACFRHVATSRASVPEAPIHENRHSLLPKNHVRFAWQISRMQCPSSHRRANKHHAKRHLCALGVLPLNRAHHSRSGGRYTCKLPSRELFSQLPLHLFMPVAVRPPLPPISAQLRRPPSSSASRADVAGFCAAS